MACSQSPPLPAGVRQGRRQQGPGGWRKPRATQPDWCPSLHRFRVTEPPFQVAKMVKATAIGGECCLNDQSYTTMASRCINASTGGNVRRGAISDNPLSSPNPPAAQCPAGARQRPHRSAVPSHCSALMIRALAAPPAAGSGVNPQRRPGGGRNADGQGLGGGTRPSEEGKQPYPAISD